MADCIYTIEGSDKTYSESEFKKLLNEGYLDKVMMDKGIKIRGIKPDEAMASSFQLPSAVQPQVQPAEITETVTPTTEATETVTPEVRTEEVVTPTETVTKTEEVVTEPTTKTKQPVEETTPEAKQKRIETATKNFADFLRGAKIEDGSARSNIIPIPPKLWNKAVDIVADSVQAGGVSLGNFSDFLDASIKNIKDSDLFKSLTPKEKGNFTRNIRKELAKYAADQFNLTFNQADIRDAEFNNLKNDLEAAKTTKPTDRQLETLKNKAKKFVERNLPDDVYNKSEVLKEVTLE